MSKCETHNEQKSLVGHYSFRGVEYTYKVCPVCYPARTNVANALNRLAANIELG